MLCELAQNWADWDATKRHYELMARFVHPHFQKSRDLLRGSYDYAVGHHVDFIGQASAAIQKEIDRHAATRGAAEAGGGRVGEPGVAVPGAIPQVKAQRCRARTGFSTISRGSRPAPPGALSGVRGEIEARVRDQLERVLAGMDLVSREEFEAAKAMAAKAREEQEMLLRRIDELEDAARRCWSGARAGRRTAASTS